MRGHREPGAAGRGDPRKPMASSPLHGLLFGAIAANREDWLETWKKLPPDSDVPEIRRNTIVRFPTLWLRLRD